MELVKLAKEVLNKLKLIDIDLIEVNEEPEELVDIEVKDNHTFCVGKLNIISHNCNNMVKTWTIPALKTNTPVMVVNHVYVDPSAMFPSKIKEQSGGSGIKYLGHITIQTARLLEKEEDREAENAYKGTNLRCFVVKNRIVKPFYGTAFYLDFEKGAEKWGGLFEAAAEYGFIKEDGKKWVVPSYSETKKFWKRELVSKEENPDIDEIWESFIDEFDKVSMQKIQYSSLEEEEKFEEAFEKLQKIDEKSTEDVKVTEDVEIKINDSEEDTLTDDDIGIEI
jgi:RecA/RadA recombinase